MGNLQGRVALVTGVSRPAGIAATVAQRLHDRGATVFATGWPAHDDATPWGGAPLGPRPFPVHRHDFADPDAPGALVDEVVRAHGALDIVVAVHARSSRQGLGEVTAAELDASFAVNVRSVVLLARHFARHRAGSGDGSGDRSRDRPGGRMVWFTSGQALGPMPDEIPYVVSKAALHQMTASMADALADHGIVANCVNPGPVDTGYADAETSARIAAMFPARRWGTPHDVANLVAFLVSDEGAWIQGQVIDSEGGFRRHRPPADA